MNFFVKLLLILWLSNPPRIELYIFARSASKERLFLFSLDPSSLLWRFTSTEIFKSLQVLLFWRFPSLELSICGRIIFDEASNFSRFFGWRGGREFWNGIDFWPILARKFLLWSWVNMFSWYLALFILYFSNEFLLIKINFCELRRHSQTIFQGIIWIPREITFVIYSFSLFGHKHTIQTKYDNTMQFPLNFRLPFWSILLHKIIFKVGCIFLRNVTMNGDITLLLTIILAIMASLWALCSSSSFFFFSCSFFIFS